MAIVYAQDLYSTIVVRLRDWLNVAGGAVASIELDLMNRAQARLQREAEWDGQILRYTCVLSGNVATMPADFLREVRVFHDSDADGKPDFFYYQNADANNGYKKQDVFAKATGHVITLTFFAAPQATPIVEYIPLLADFANSSTEYSYYPGELLLRCAQVIHCEEQPAEVTNGDYQAILNSYKDQLQKYKRAHLGTNRGTQRQITDSRGQQYRLDNIGLDGNAQQASRDFSRDTDQSQNWGN